MSFAFSESGFVKRKVVCQVYIEVSFILLFVIFERLLQSFVFHDLISKSVDVKLIVFFHKLCRLGKKVRLVCFVHFIFLRKVVRNKAFAHFYSVLCIEVGVLSLFQTKEVICPKSCFIASVRHIYNLCDKSLLRFLVIYYATFVQFIDIDTAVAFDVKALLFGKDFKISFSVFGLKNSQSINRFSLNKATI